MRSSDWSSDVCSSDLRIAGHVFEAMPATVVTLREGDCTGRGEAAGVYYNDDHPDAMLATLEALRPRIEAGIGRDALSDRQSAVWGKSVSGRVDLGGRSSISKRTKNNTRREQ